MQSPSFTTLRILTYLLAVTLAAASILGAFVPSTYELDSASIAAQGAGQDLVNLFLVVPLLLITFRYASRGHRTAALLYGGTLFYILYSFVIYCFGVHFNHAFLLYCATLGLSLYSFILLVSGLRDSQVEEWFAGAPVKLVSVYLFLVAVIFYGMWLGSIVPAMVEGRLPADVADYGLLVNPVHVADLAFALPGLLIGSVLIWRKRAMGYIISSVALVFMILLTIALAAMVVMVTLRGISEDFSVAAVFGVLTLTSITITVLLFRRIQR